ncbi:MAG: hypothetical protein HQL52_05120 [Magnetococcales bacterium]|nr:hypothetical protein [Magnetococcales bacterium]
MSTTPPNKQPQADSTPPSAELDRLRELLMGVDRKQIKNLSDSWNDPGQHAHKVAEIISEAIILRSGKDQSIPKALGETITDSIQHTVREKPTLIADIFSPIIGQALHKSIVQAMTEMLHTLNDLLEQSLSFRFITQRFKAWRAGQPYAQYILRQNLIYQVEQVFLIHKETSLLVGHVASESAVTQGPDGLSGMLSTIQGIVRDSFQLAEGDQLKTMKMGDLTLLIQSGPHAVLALAVRGRYPKDLTTLMADAMKSIHILYGQALQTFDGNITHLTPVQSILAGCLKRKDRRENQKRKMPWLAILLILIVGAIGGWFSYQQHLTQKRAQALWQTNLDRISTEPGYAILDWHKSPTGYQVSGLRDPLARPPRMVLAGLTQPPERIHWQWREYLSLDEAIQLKRITGLLSPPDTVRMQLDENNLILTGHAPLTWVERAVEKKELLPGVRHINIDYLMKTRGPPTFLLRPPPHRPLKPSRDPQVSKGIETP